MLVRFVMHGWDDKWLSQMYLQDGSVGICLYRNRAYSTGKSMCERLKDAIPRQMFEIAVQAAIGSKIIARET